MRRLHAILPLVLLPLTLAAGTTLSWLETEHDFGVIRESDGKVTCRMRLVNTGDSALVITQVRTSCGCTASDFPRQPVAPGDTAAVTVTYNPDNRPGAFEKNLFVYTNGLPQRSQLTIKGQVIAREQTLDTQYPDAIGPLRLEAASLPLGKVNRPKRRTAHMTVFNPTLDTLVATIDRVPDHWRLTHFVPDTIAPGATAVLIATIDAQTAPLWGLNCDTLAVGVRGPQGTATGTVEVMAQVGEDFSRLTDRQRERAPHIDVSTELLNTFATDGNKPQARFTVTNTGRDPLLLRRIWSPEKAVTIEADRTEVKRGKTATVTVSVDPDALGGTLLNTMLTIISNDPDRPAATMRLAAQLSH